MAGYKVKEFVPFLWLKLNVNFINEKYVLWIADRNLSMPNCSIGIFKSPDALVVLNSGIFFQHVINILFVNIFACRSGT